MTILNTLNKIEKLVQQAREEVEKSVIANRPLVKTPKTITITDDHKKKTSELMDECRKLFQVYSYWDNNKLDKNFPPPQKTTKRKFAYTQEPDENYKNMSADDLAKLDVEFMTFRERIIFELLYWEKEGKHLDIDNWTLCSGSRDSDGGVPNVNWDSDYDRLVVLWAHPDHAYGDVRCRAVVS